MGKKAFNLLVTVLAVAFVLCAFVACNPSEGEQDVDNPSQPAHTHNLVRHEAVAATCETAGSVEYWECVSCGEKFSDADGTPPISDTSLAPLGHDYVLDWDDENHFDRCTRCGNVTNIVPHTFDDGVCTVCKYEDKGTEGLEYTLSADGTYYTLSGVGEATASDIFVPSLYQSKPVTAIGARAFANCVDITSVTFGRRIESIGEAAFYGCDALGEIRYGGNVAEWCELSGQENIMAQGRALYISDEKAEGALVIPDGISAVKPYSFAYQSGITSVTVPDSVTEIGEYAFFGCSAVEKITLPFLGASLSGGSGNNVSVGYVFGGTDKIPSVLREVSVSGGSVPAGAFAGCAALTSVTLGADVTSVGSGVLGICTSLEEVGVPYLGSSADDQNSAGLNMGYVFGGVSRIPASLKKATVIGGSIPAGAFEGCTELTGVVLGENVTYIEGGVLSGFGSLEELTIPFVGSSADSSYGDAYQYPLGYIFGTSSYAGGVSTRQRYYDSAGKYTGQVHYYIPSALRNVTVLGGNTINSAFYECSMLESVSIGSGPQSIELLTFYNCSNLISVIIPDTVTSIELNAFRGCSSLASIYYSGTLSGWLSIDGLSFLMNEGRDLFIAGERLEGEIAIPEGVDSVAPYAFAYQSRITSVFMPESLISIGVRAFSSCTGLISVTLPKSVKTIGANAFAYCESLDSFDMPDYITGIENGVFAGCSSLKSISIPDGVKDIGDSAFSGCTSLSYLYLPDGIMSLSHSAFRWCQSLNEVHIPDSVTSIGATVFQGCVGLSSIDLPYGITSIGSGAFADCVGLSSLVLPESVTILNGDPIKDCDIPYNEYDNAYYLGSVSNPYYALITAKSDTITSCDIHPSTRIIAGSAFEGILGLTSISIPDSVVTIGSAAFLNCSNLASVSIGKNTELICELAFRDCTSLRSIVIPDSVKTIGVNAFFECTALETVVMGSGVEVIEVAAFNICTSLTSIVIPASVTRIDAYAFSLCNNMVSVIFEDPSKWAVYSRNDNEYVASLPANALADETEALYYLVSRYDDYNWKKN